MTRPKKIKERVILGVVESLLSKKCPKNAPPAIGSEMEKPSSEANDIIARNLLFPASSSSFGFFSSCLASKNLSLVKRNTFRFSGTVRILRAIFF